MWNLIIPFLTNVFNKDGPISQYFKTKNDIVQAENQKQLAIKNAEIELAREEAKARVEAQANQLSATTSNFKTFSFILLTAPIILLCIKPAFGLEIFNNLALLPGWYAQLYVAVVGVIWGLPIAQSAVSGIFQAVNNAWASRQDKKIEKIQALGEATALNLQQAKKEIFDTLRKANGALTQSQVDAINPVLDKVIQIQSNATTTESTK